MYLYVMTFSNIVTNRTLPCLRRRTNQFCSYTYFNRTKHSNSAVSTLHELPQCWHLLKENFCQAFGRIGYSLARTLQPQRTKLSSKKKNSAREGGKRSKKFSQVSFPFLLSICLSSYLTFDSLATFPLKCCSGFAPSIFGYLCPWADHPYWILRSQNVNWIQI